MRTAIATGEWQILPGHGGLNLYIGNHAAANGTYTVVDGVRPSIAGQRDDMRRVAEQGEGRSLTDAEVSSHFVRQSLAWWQRAPVAAIRLFAYKLWLTTHAWELPVNVSYAWLREQVLLLRLLPVGAWLLVPFGLAASLGGQLAVPDAHRAAWRWFRWLLPVYLASVATFFVVDRYRAPALVLGAVLVGVLASMRRSTGEAPRGRGAWRRDGRRGRHARSGTDPAAVPSGGGRRRHAHGPARDRRWPRRRRARVARSGRGAASGARGRVVPGRIGLAGAQPAR